MSDSGARWNWELAVKPRVKFRQIWVFTAKFLKIKVFRQKSGKSVSKMHFLQRIIALLAVPPHFSPPSGDWIPPVLSYLAVNSAIWHRCTPPDEDPYRPEACMDNSGAQLFVIYDCICNGVYIQEVLTHLIKCDVTLFFIVLSLCL